jgi:carbon-monoxide dehydrogenase medium subunit
VIGFEYVQPRTIDAALATLVAAGRDARVLAGGTDVVVRLRARHLRPRIVVDIKRAEGLDATIMAVDGVLRIGARCTLATILADSRVAALFPALVEAARIVGSVQIRHRATLAGNICNASPAADTAPPLLIYGAVVNVISAAGSRAIPLSGFFTGPGKTVLALDELVASIDLPLPSAPVGAAFTRLTRRRGVDLATLTVCAATFASGIVRVALGAVAPTPLLVTMDDVSALRDEARRDEAISRIAAQASPISDVRASAAYRLGMLPVYIRRAVELALRRLDEDLTWNSPDSQSSSQ